MKLLFVSHDATLTGAPVLLLNLIAVLKEQPKYSIRVILKNGSGALINDFKNAAESLIWKYEVNKALPARIVRKATALAGIQNQNNIKIQQWINESDVVFSNTITNGDFFRAFNFSKVRLVLSYIHELEIATGYYTNKEDVSVVKKITNRFLVPSNAVATHLINNLDIAADTILPLNYYVPITRKPGIPTIKNGEAFVVGLIGTLDWRKGADILTVIIADFFRKYPQANVLFVWKGADTNSIECQRIAYELKKLNLSAKLRFEPPSKEVNDFYNAIDILLLVSKEDPYPLVVLEAASNYKPCICFDNAGGAPEFVSNDAGDIVPYLDIGSISNTIYNYYTEPQILRAKGVTAQSKYLSMHCNKDVIATQFSAAVQQEYPEKLIDKIPSA